MVGNGRDKKGLYSYTMDEIRQGLFLSWPDAKVIVRLTLVFSERYQQAKQEKNLADFSDVQHMALQLLVEEGRPTAIAQVYREQFEEIYIDEYQDSNEVQELLLQAISREDEGEPNRFMVGDVKQSIYMFRQARPQIFMEKYEDYSEEAGAPFRNFRSRWEVLEGINALFFRLMTKGLGGIAYTERTALHPGAMYPDLEGEKAPRVQMLWMDLSQDEVEKEGALEEVEQEQEDAMVWEARLVAMKIREVTDPLHGLKLWDGERQQFRKAEYRDIVILMRSLTGSMESWMEVMEKEGIPCYGETRTGYFDAFEVQSVLQFLRLLDNPLQDIPLASVMHGPMGGFSSLELAILKQLTERYIGTSFFYRIFSLPQEQVLKEQPQHRLLLEKVTAFSKWLQEKRDEAGRLPLHEFLRHALEETGYMYYVGAMPNGKKRLANLEMLMEKAMTYEETSYHGLFHFVRYVEQLQKYAVDVPQPSLLGETENVVRIMTIHKSKGLEFPIVFLSGMHKKFNMQDTRKNMLMHPALGMAMDATKKDYRLRVRTLNKQVLARRIQLDTQGEELRILYVAMTRAREYLFLTGAKDKLQEYLGKKRLVSAVEGENGALPYVTLAGGNSFMDWVVAASVGIQEDLISEQIWTNDMLTVVRAEEREQEWDQASTLENLALEQSQTAYWFPLWDAHVLGKYPYEVETTQKAIVSVSALKKESMRQEELDVTSSFEIWEKKQDKSEGISAAQRGTMYHKALELMDFTSGKLKDSPHVDWKVVQKTHLLQLWKSPLGRRMQQAAQKGKLHKEQQFLMGLPLYEDTEKAAEGPFRLIRGIIDVFWEEEDGLVLLDYKTDHLPDEDWEKVLVDRYHTQLEYYGLALEKMTRKPVKEIWLYAISKNKAIKV